METKNGDTKAEAVVVVEENNKITRTDEEN